MACVITTEAHLAFAGAKVQSNNTAEMSAMIEALSFLGPHVPDARDSCSCVFYHSKHAAGICLGTIQARTHVQLALSFQQSLLKVQHKLRFTMQHVYGHAENLGNECADHAAALGAFGLVSNHNLSTRWTHHSFDSASCFASCDNLGDVLEKLRDIRTEHVSASRQQTRSRRFVPHRATLCSSCLRHCPLGCSPFILPAYILAVTCLKDVLGNASVRLFVCFYCFGLYRHHCA